MLEDKRTYLSRIVGYAQSLDFSRFKKADEAKEDNWFDDN